MLDVRRESCQSFAEKGKPGRANAPGLKAAMLEERQET
jgi:hypothetical protein